MKIIRDFAAFADSYRGGVLSIGKFDGLHCGHIEILRTLVKRSRQYQIPSIVFTFDPSPIEILRPEAAPPIICNTDQKIDLISAFDPDLLFVFPTTKEFLNLSADEFFQKIVCDGIGAESMVEGENFSFGRKRSGNGEKLRLLCEAQKIHLDIIPSVTVDGQPVSSSRIRNLLLSGDAAAVQKMLRRPYRILGQVIHGDHRGRLLGYPTANLSEITTLIPKVGLYAARVLYDGVFYPAAVNLGGNPTFGVNQTKIEVHLLDFNGDLYGQRIQVDFLTRLRDICPFENKDALLAQMSEDIAKVRQIAASQPIYTSME